MEFFIRFCTPHADLRVDYVLAGATTSKAKAQQMAREVRHNHQKNIINAKLETGQERLRAEHRSDRRWFEEIARARDAMLVQMALNAYSL